jgi:chaperonin GroES
MNQSGIHPQGHRVLVKPLEIEQRTASGIILATEGQKEREDMSNTTGEVIAMGNDCFPDQTPWCKPGDRVVFAKYSGLLYQGKDGMRYRIINDDNVVATLDSDVRLVDPYLITKRHAA